MFDGIIYIIPFVFFASGELQKRRVICKKVSNKQVFLLFVDFFKGAGLESRIIFKRICPQLTDNNIKVKRGYMSRPSLCEERLAEPKANKKKEDFFLKQIQRH